MMIFLGNFINIIYIIIYMNYSPDSIYYCNNNDNLELSNKIYERNLPSQKIKPYFDARPSSSKYATMPIIELKNTNHQVSLKEYLHTG